MPPEPKSCASCGRRIEWRKKWERDWDQVRYCSTACRRRGVTSVDRELEQVLRDLLHEGRGRSVVDVDEAVGRVDPSDPDALREPARRAARRLVAEGVAEAVQKGRVVDASTARGPFALRRPSR